jgi:hypothetical protein
MNNPHPCPANPRSAPCCLAGRILEISTLFGFVPALLATGLVRLPPMPALWAGGLYCLLRLRLDGRLDLVSA